MTVLTIADSSWIPLHLNLAPGWLEVPISRGTPAKAESMRLTQALSSWSKCPWTGPRIRSKGAGFGGRRKSDGWSAAESRGEASLMQPTSARTPGAAQCQEPEHYVCRQRGCTHSWTALLKQAPRALPLSPTFLWTPASGAFFSLKSETQSLFTVHHKI